MMIERTYIVPLRKEINKVPKYKRAKRAIVALQRFLKKHMKSEEVSIGKYANEYLWSRGIKNPPYKIEVVVKKQDDGKVIAELKGKPFPEISKKEKKQDKNKIEQAVEKLTGSKKKDDKKEIKDAEIIKEEKTKPALTKEAPTPKEKEPVNVESAKPAPSKKVTDKVQPIPAKK